jgi:predicted RNA-binding protein with TRAM domain
MEVPEKLRCLFSAQVEEHDGSYVVEVPTEELRRGEIEPGATYRVAILSSSSETETGETDTQSESSRGEPDRERGPPEPPVAEGDTREVEIENIGEQGDGIARVERGFVVIVPDTELGERVTVEITDVKQNVAFADVVERQTHF